jgi:hypothetical protein
MMARPSQNSATSNISLNMTDSKSNSQSPNTTLDRPPQEHSPIPKQEGSLLRRLESAFGPIVAGLLIDVMDLSTMGPIGLICGMPLGGGLAYWICSIYGIPMKQRWIWVALAGIYCTIPSTGFIPVATFTGAYVRFRNPPPRNENTCAEDTH